jgi:hypothetical protein
MMRVWGDFVGVAVTYITSSRDAPLTERLRSGARQCLVVAKITQNRVNEFICSWCKSANFNTSFYVTDLARSVKFYNEVLGFAPIDADERITATSVGGRHVLPLCKKGDSKDWVSSSRWRW